jgi:hypothetical protein
VVIEKREMSIFILLIINNGSRAESWTGKKQGALPARDELSGSLAWSVQKTYPGTFVPCTRTRTGGCGREDDNKTGSLRDSSIFIAIFAQ